MVYRGHVQNGRIELDEPVSLPEGATVELSIVNGGQMPKTGQSRVVELLRRWQALPTERDTAYWDDLERDVSDNRLSFRDFEPHR
ncbi:MAG TPA: hypothetical protein VGM03_11645 [Phycisphaerae bacterium]|jgi:hypothetical protein